MTYSEFNKKILDFYVARATSELCVLSFDRYDMESIMPIEKIVEFKHLQLSWRDLLNKKNDEPQYFGIIAIQCLAASEMQDDDEKTENAYQIRLRQLLSLED